MHDADKDDALPLPRYTNHEVSQAIAQAIAQGIDKDEVAVAVTRDGRVYVGKAVPPSKITQSILKRKHLAKLIWWVGKVDYFFFVRVLRLPYLFDWIRTVRATRLQKRSGIK